MNNKNLDKVLNSFDNFEIPKAAQTRTYATNGFQNSPDSRFAAEAVKFNPQRNPNQPLPPPPAFVRQQAVSQPEQHVIASNVKPLAQPQLQPPVTIHQVAQPQINTPKPVTHDHSNVKVEVTKNISNYIPYADKGEGVKILADGKVFKKKFSVKIMGIGGAGNNIVKYLSAMEWPEFVEIIALNTDYNALNRMPEVENRYIIGADKLNGNGAGGDPKIAKEVAEDDNENIKKQISGADILILVAGLGKGTGTGATPVVARLANELGILTIGLFNLPSIGAEGKRIYANALEGLETLQNVCSGFTAIANDRVIGADRERTSIKKAYDAANDYFRMIVSEFIYMIAVGSDINIDFSDIKNFFKEKNGFIFLKVNIADYSRDSIKKSIEEAIEFGYIEIDLRESTNALYNLKINENVPSIILENSRAALKDILKTNDLNVVQGMDFNGLHESAELNIMLSGKFDLGKLSAPTIFEAPKIEEPIILEPEPTPIISEPLIKTTSVFEPTSSINDSFTSSFSMPETTSISSEPTTMLPEKTNIIRTEEILENSYLTSQASNNSVGTKVSFWKKLKNFFTRK